MDVRIVGGQRIERRAGIDDLGAELAAVADDGQGDLTSGPVPEDIRHQLLQGKEEGFADVVGKLAPFHERLQRTADLAQPLRPSMDAKLDLSQARRPTWCGRLPGRARLGVMNHVDRLLTELLRQDLDADILDQ